MLNKPFNTSDLFIDLSSDTFWRRHTITIVIASTLGVVICVQFIFIYFSLGKGNEEDNSKPKTCARHAAQLHETKGSLAKEIEEEIGMAANRKIKAK